MYGFVNANQVRLACMLKALENDSTVKKMVGLSEHHIKLCGDCSFDGKDLNQSAIDHEVKIYGRRRARYRNDTGGHEAITSDSWVKMRSCVYYLEVGPKGNICDMGFSCVKIGYGNTHLSGLVYRVRGCCN